MNARFTAAMTAYAVLALMGSIFLTGQARTAIWILLGALALKTAIVVASRKDEQ